MEWAFVECQILSKTSNWNATVILDVEADEIDTEAPIHEELASTGGQIEFQVVLCEMRTDSLRVQFLRDKHSTLVSVFGKQCLIIDLHYLA